MKDDRFVIVDTRTTCGNSVFFWCFDHSGYTCDLRMAGIYTFDEAQAIEKNRSTDKVYRYADVLKLVQFHVDCQDLYRKPMPTEPHTFSHLGVRT